MLLHAAVEPIHLAPPCIPQQSGELEKSRAAYERAAMSQDKIGSTWHAAKHLESASQISRDLGEWGSVADFARQAAGYFAQAGRPTAGARGRGGRRRRGRRTGVAACSSAEGVRGLLQQSWTRGGTHRPQRA
jgi:hypothetical protein